MKAADPVTEPPCVELAGLSLTALTRAQVVDHVFDRLAHGHGGWVVTPNLDHLRRYVAEEELHRLFAAADLVVADGMPLLWAARLQGTPLPERVAGSDLVWLLAERAAAEGRSLYLLGGRPGSAEAAAGRLRERWPALRIAGISSPMVSDYPTAEEIASIRTEIAAARPDLVYVAFGAPKQERVIAGLRESAPHTWWLGIGISLSFIAGDVRRAPVWLQRAGLEWVTRLVQEPSRLFRRYILDDLPFAIRLLAQSARHRFRSTIPAGRG